MGRKNRLERKRPRNQGPAELSKAADQKVYARFDDLANVLLDNALQGNATSASLLIRLAEGAEWDQILDLTTTGPTLSEQWTAERHWDGPVGEKDSETQTGSREPE